ncbi:divergent polysaccharide deacetylase family protein [Orbaceae bacterium ac157xtp]
MKKQLIVFISILFICPFGYAAQLALVIDDFGYRLHNEEQVIALSPNITIAVLPNAPNAKKMAHLAHDNGNDVIVHLPMAPFGKQPLEVDTLKPDMTQDEITRIVAESLQKVPYAIGINNHMGSLMTSDLEGMKKVMQALQKYDLFFVDSFTIATSKGQQVAKEYGIPTIKRDVFLDDSQQESDIAHQFDLAIAKARKQGYAVAIGHPYSNTVKVLNDKLAHLPNDIELVKVSSLIDPKPKSEPKPEQEPESNPKQNDYFNDVFNHFKDKLGKGCLFFLCD